MRPLAFTVHLAISFRACNYLPSCFDKPEEGLFGLEHPPQKKKELGACRLRSSVLATSSYRYERHESGMEGSMNSLHDS